MNNPGIWCLVFLITFSGIQLVPFPSTLLNVVSKITYQLWQLDFLRETFVKPTSLLTFSLNPYNTANHGILFLCYFLGFIASLTITESHKSSRTISVMIPVIIITGVMVALVDVIQKQLDVKAIYGFWVPILTDHFTGPYVNYNHFAGYLELSILLLPAMVTYIYCRSGKNYSAFILGWLCVGATLLGSSCIILSGSRGGILSFSAVFCLQFMTIMFFLYRRHFLKTWLVIASGIVIVFGLVLVATDWTHTVFRFGLLFRQNIAENIRVALYTDVLHMGNAFPLTGSGLETFGDVFTMFKTFPLQGYFAHAHNDYLQFFAETGWPGLIMLLGFLGGVVYSGGATIYAAVSKKSSIERRPFLSAILIIGTLAAMLSLSLHGLVDFNLSIPANALTWFVLCGITIGLSRGKTTPTYTTKHRTKSI